MKESKEKRRIRHASGQRNLTPYKSAPGTRRVSPFGTPSGKNYEYSKRPHITGTTVVTPTNQSPQVKHSKILKMSTLSNRMNSGQKQNDMRKAKVTLDQLVPSRNNKQENTFQLKKATLG